MIQIDWWLAVAFIVGEIAILYFMVKSEEDKNECNYYPFSGSAIPNMNDLDKDFEAVKPAIRTLALEFRRMEKTANETNDAVMLHRAIRVRNTTLDALRTKFGFAVWHEFLTHYYDKKLEELKQR
jgi:hypothetical protein